MSNEQRMILTLVIDSLIKPGTRLPARLRKHQRKVSNIQAAIRRLGLKILWDEVGSRIGG